MALGDKIRSLRESQGLSQKELATKIGVSTGTIAEWESNEIAPDIAALARLSKALSVSSDELLCSFAEDVPIEKESPKGATKIHKKRKISAIAYLLIAVGALSILIVSLLAGYEMASHNETETTFAEVKPFSQDSMAIENADASVVTIFCYDYEGELASTGSGFVAFDGKTIVTNYHVMTSAYTCKVSTNQDISYGVAHVLAYSKEQDVAILQLAEDTGLEPLTLGDSKAIKKGEPVVAIGSPLGIKNTVSSGVLSGRLMEDNMDVLQFTAPISSGSSGGALFDDNGNVIGITYGSYVNGQNLNLAIPIELVEAIYQSGNGQYDVSAICVNEYPYIGMLDHYDSAISITLDALLSNPEAFRDKLVKVQCYYSSTSRHWELFVGRQRQKNVMYLTTKSLVTGDSELDRWCYDRMWSGEIKQQILEVDLFDDLRFYIPKDVRPGTMICWIGVINGYIRGRCVEGTTALCYCVEE